MWHVSEIYLFMFFDCAFFRSFVVLVILPFFTLLEKRPNRELFLVHIFLYSDQIEENTDLR